MIVFAAYGGLGNQLFQYATGRSLAMLRGTELVVDPTWFENVPSDVTFRQYELGRYDIAARLPTAVERRAIPLMRGRFTRRLPFLHRWHLVRETSSRHYDEAVLQAPNNSYLDGYWQSARYFDGIRKTLLQELQPRAPMAPADQAVAARMAEGEAVSVHVRRSDYVTHSRASQTHGTCSIEYYQDAFAALRQQVKNPQLFIFSDDPDWTRENLRLDAPTEYVTHNGGDTAFQDIRLMSLCRHHIIANSSFSWWGAWLATNPEQKVYAPRKWYAQMESPTHVIPAAWNLM